MNDTTENLVFQKLKCKNFFVNLNHSVNSFKPDWVIVILNEDTEEDLQIEYVNPYTG